MKSTSWLALAASVLLDQPRIVAGQDYPGASSTYWNSSSTSTRPSSGFLSSSPLPSISSTAQSSSSRTTSSSSTSDVFDSSQSSSVAASSYYRSSSPLSSDSISNSQPSSTSNTAQGMGDLIMGGLGQTTTSISSSTIPTISVIYSLTNSSATYASSSISQSLPTLSSSSIASSRISSSVHNDPLSSRIPILSASNLVSAHPSSGHANSSATSSMSTSFNTTDPRLPVSHNSTTTNLRISSSYNLTTASHSSHSLHGSAVSSQSHSHHPSASSASHPLITPAASLYASHHRNVTANYTSVTGCQADLASWSRLTSEIVQSYVWTQSTTLWWTSTESIQYGHAKHHHKQKVIDGATHFSWAWDVTSTSLYAASWPLDWNATYTSPLPTSTSIFPPKPTCTIEPTSCAALWTNYAHFLGLSGNKTFIELDKSSYAATHPDMSPRCTQGGTTATCLTRRAYRANPSCAIGADSVRVYFWPHETSTKTSHASPTITSPTITPAPRVISTFGINMTSPSVYLHFDNLGAVTNGIEWLDCQNGTSSYHWWFSNIGKMESTKQWFSVRPDALSTMEKVIGIPGLPSASLAALKTIIPGALPSDYVRFPDQALTAMYEANATDYSFWATMIYSASEFRPTKLRHLSQLTQPDPRAYYLRPFSNVQQPDRYARGCHPQGPHPACNTIFDLRYRAQISFPEDIGELNPKWRSCEPWVFGVYDPAVELQETDQIFIPDVTTSNGIITAVSATPVPGANVPTVAATLVPSAQPDQHTSAAPGGGSPASPTQAVNPASPSPPAGNSPVNSQPNQPQATSGTNVVNPPSGTDNTPAQGNNVNSQTISFSNVVLPAPTPQSVAFSTPPANDPAAQTQANNNGGIVLVQPDGNGGAATVVLPNGNGGTLAQLQPGSTEAALTQNQANGNEVAAPAPAPVAVITAGGSTLTAASSDGLVVFGTQTLLAGQATILNGDTISNAGTAMLVNPAPQAVPSTAAVAVITAGGNTLTASSGAAGAVVVGSTTIAAGQAVTIDGSIVSNNGAAIIVSPSGTSGAAVAINQPGEGQVSPVATVGGQIIAQDNNKQGILIDGSKTVQPGQQITIDGTSVSVGPSFVVVGSTTIPLAQAGHSANAPLATVAGQLVVPDSQSQGVVIGASTLHAGQQTTISGTVVSVGPDAFVVGSNTIRLPAAATPAQNAAIETISGSLMLNLGSTTIALPASNTALTAPGVHTATLAISKPPSITIAGSSIITAGSSGQFIVGGQTLTPGGSAITVSGTTYSLGASDSYLVVNGKTTSIAKPGTSSVVEVFTISTSNVIANKETTSVKAATATSLVPLPGASSRLDHSLLTTLLAVVMFAFGLSLL